MLEQRIITGVVTEMARQAEVLRAQLREDMRHQSAGLVEQIGGNARVIDEKYQDLPPRVAALEEHARDSAIHGRPAAPPKRATKRRKR